MNQGIESIELKNNASKIASKFTVSIPVVVCAPNIKELVDVSLVAKTMNYLADNPNAYNHLLRWEYEGLSDLFKALLDMAAVRFSWRFESESEEKNSISQKRRCKCTRGVETVYCVSAYMSEKEGDLNWSPFFHRSNNLTLKAFNTFQYELKVYKIYPLGFTQR